MRKVTDFIVKARYVFLTLFVILTIFSLYLGTKVNINEDIKLEKSKQNHQTEQHMEGIFHPHL